jgi:hypothetical protein
MRLFEVEDRFTNDLVTIIRNLVGRSDSKHAPQSLSYAAISNLLSNLGYGQIGYDEFASVYDKSPDLQALVKNFNEEGIVLGTKAEQKPEDSPVIPTPKGPSVDTMAHQAANYNPQLSPR